MEFDTASSAFKYMVNVTGDTLWPTELPTHMVIH